MSEGTPKRRRSTGSRPTMHDVARLAGVSQTTVSFVVNGREEAGISDETKARILDAMRKLGYRPNAVAQALRRGTSNLIGLITDEIITTPYAVEIVKGAQDAAQAAGKLLVVLTVTDEPWSMEQVGGVMVEHRVEGVVLATMFHRGIDVPGVLEDVPVALANCFTTTRPVPIFIPDEFQGGFDAVTHLIHHGHTRIAYLNNVDDIPATRLRLAGYREALRAANIAEDERLVVRATGSDQAAGYDAAVTLLKEAEGNLPTALFCFNDRMAMGAYAALNEHGLSIPSDMSVVGFDNQVLLSAHLRPGLTTLQLPHYEMGRRSVEALLRETTAPERTLLPCPLVQRDSVATVVRPGVAAGPKGRNVRVKTA